MISSCFQCIMKRLKTSNMKTTFPNHVWFNYKLTLSFLRALVCLFVCSYVRLLVVCSFLHCSSSMQPSSMSKTNRRNTYIFSLIGLLTISHVNLSLSLSLSHTHTLSLFPSFFLPINF
jgi:hypothetical protein